MENFWNAGLSIFKQAVDLKLSVATSGFLTVPSERNCDSTLGHWDCLCEGLLEMKKGIAASAVLNCVFKMWITVLVYCNWLHGLGGVSKNLTGCVDALSWVLKSKY